MGSCLSRSSHKVEQLDKVQKWRASHSSSVRSSMIARKDGDIKDHYFLHNDQVLGKGACGVVVTGERRAQQKEKLYAVKICDKSLCDIGRLEREILLLGDVDHSNVVRLFEVYATPSTMYLVTEFCSGGHLGTLLNSQKSGGILKRLHEEDAKGLCRQLLSAVRHLHERGIAHRDIKLQNILVDRVVEDTGCVHKPLSQVINLKIIDFGFGSRFVGCCPMKTVCGTPYTTAPEVLRESYDERCDVWSLGVVLFIMLSGKRPFESLNVRGPLTEAGKVAMTTNILSGRYSFGTDNWAGVSQEAKNFVRKLLAPNYRLRVHAKEAMSLPWMRDLISTSIEDRSEKIRSLSRDLSFNSTTIGGSAKVHPSDDPETATSLKEEASNAPTKGHMGPTEQPRQGSALENVENEPLVTNILKNTHSASARSEMRRCGNMALAFGLHGDAVRDIRELFQTVDLDGSGALSLSEFSEAMMILCPTLSEADCSLVFNTMDVNRDDQITFTEFLAASLNPDAVDIAELNDAFTLLDSNNDGYISLEEIRKIYSFKHMKKKRPVQRKSDCGQSVRNDSPAASAKLGERQSNEEHQEELLLDEEKQLPKIFTSTLMTRNQEMSLEEQVESMISACDIDHDGKISHEEFIFAMTGAMSLFDSSKKQASQVLNASASSSKLRQIKSESSVTEGAEETKTSSVHDCTSLYEHDKAKDKGELEVGVLEQHFSEERRKLSLTTQDAHGGADLGDDQHA